MLVCSQPILRERRPERYYDRPKAPTWLSLWCLDTMLSNAIDALRWDDPLVLKVMACEGCGEPGCPVGDCVSVYRIGDDVVWLPLEDWLEDKPEKREAYWAPPAYLNEHGCVVFPRVAWDRLRERAPHVPVLDSLPGLPDRRLAEFQ